MYQEERMQAILEYLKTNKRITVEIICNLYNVSKDTARRDLVALEEKGSILRTHGGAILPILDESVKSYNDRLNFSSKEKKAIGKLASSLIKDGEKIILDTSTTVQACAEFLQAQNCYVITNSINLADLLSDKPTISVYLLGGEINKKHRYLYGPPTISMLSNYFVDKVFIGALGISENGITTADHEDGFVIKKMIEQANQVILLADHTKFGNKGFFKFADLSEIDLIITDKLPDKKLMKKINENNIKIILAEAN